LPDPTGQDPNQTGGQDPQTPTGNEGQGGQGSQGLTPEQLQAQLKAVRAEAASSRVLAKELQAKLDEINAASMSEAEKLQKKLSDLEKLANEREAGLKSTTLRLNVEREARKLNIVDEDAAYRLIDQSRVEFDGSGNPSNVAALLTELTKSKPWLLAQPGAGSSSGSAGNPDRSGQRGSLTIAQLKQMTPKQVAALDPKMVDAALAAGV